MLPKHLRLPYQQSLKTRQDSRRFETQYFRLFYSPAHSNLFLVTIPKKYIKLSTKRHLLKRLFHEALRTVEPKLKQRGEFVIQLKKPIDIKKLNEAIPLITELFAQANLC